uniref:CBS domain-containing protein n=1 Tax=Angiostrongylus cantonensis TaxID=6313 RepID=A0A0K0D615_ANGCA
MLSDWPKREDATNSTTSAIPQKLKHAIMEIEPDVIVRLLQRNACAEAIPRDESVLVLNEDMAVGQGRHHVLLNGDSFVFYLVSHLYAYSDLDVCAVIFIGTHHVVLFGEGFHNVITGVLSSTDHIRVVLKIFRYSTHLNTVAIMGIKPRSISSEPDFITAEERKDFGLTTVKRYQGKCYYILLYGISFRFETAVTELVAKVATRKNLFEAIRMLSTHRVHRLPVIDPISFEPQGILTLKHILKFLWYHGRDFFQPPHFIKTPKQLNVGTWKGLHVVYRDTPLIDCLDILLNAGVSSVPVVELPTLRVIDVYSRFDAMNVPLQNEGFDPAVDISEALKYRPVYTVGYYSFIFELINTHCFQRHVLIYIVYVHCYKQN